MTRNQAIFNFIKSVTGHKLKPEAVNKIISFVEEYDVEAPYAVLWRFDMNNKEWKSIRKAYTTMKKIDCELILSSKCTNELKWECYDENDKPIGTVYTVNSSIF